MSIANIWKRTPRGAISLNGSDDQNPVDGFVGGRGDESNTIAATGVGGRRPGNCRNKEKQQVSYHGIPFRYRTIIISPGTL